MLPGFSIALIDGGGLGVVPDAVDWANIVDPGNSYNSAQIISGIGEPILLRAEVRALTQTGLVSGELIASVNGDTTEIAVSNGSSGDFWVTPDASVFFSATGRGSLSQKEFSYTATATIKYRLAGSSSFTETLDTFTFARSRSFAD